MEYYEFSARNEVNEKYTLIESVEQYEDLVKSKDKVVCHFRDHTDSYCKMVDILCEQLAEVHPETCFVKIEAANSPDLVEKLNITTEIPTIALVKEAKVVYRMVFSDVFDHVDSYSTMELAKLCDKHGVLAIHEDELGWSEEEKDDEDEYEDED